MYFLSVNIETSLFPLCFVERYRLADGASLKVAIWMMLNKQCDEKRIAEELNMPPEKALKCLDYWVSCGLLTTELEQNSKTVSKPQTEDTPVFPLDQDRPPFSMFEVEQNMLRNPEIAHLFQEAQRYLGRTISDSETERLFSLYTLLDMPPDVLLMIVAYSKKRAKRSLFNYIEKVCRSWKTEGVDTIEKAEKHLKLLEKRERREIKVAKLLDIETDSFKYKDKERISIWFEQFGFSYTLIEEAQKYCNAEQKSSVAYINSILKDWHKNNVKTVDDTRKKQSSNAPVAVPKAKATTDSLLKRAVKKQI